MSSPSKHQDGKLRFKDSYLGKLRELVGKQLLQVPGTRAVIENAVGGILLQLRSEVRVWGLPAGSPELGDDIRTTIMREIFEETGLKVTDVTPFGFASDPSFEVFEYPNGDKIHNYSLCFHVTSWEGSLIEANDESLKLEFFHPASLPPLIRNHQRTVHSFLDYKRTGAFQFL